MNIPLIPVESSQIYAVGYDLESGTLAIQFLSGSGTARKAGSIYHYANVPPSIHQELIEAESIGKYFGINIKPFTDKYPFQKQTV